MSKVSRKDYSRYASHASKTRQYTDFYAEASYSQNLFSDDEFHGQFKVIIKKNFFKNWYFCIGIFLKFIKEKFLKFI